MDNLQDEKLFYLSGLFSVSFFLILLFSALYYGYTRDKVIKIKTEKSSGIEIVLYEAPKEKKRAKKADTTQSKPKPKPKIAPPKPPKKHIEKSQSQSEEKQPPKPATPPPPPLPPKETPKAPSFDSLFSNIDTSKLDKPKEEEQKPLVSEETIKRLRKEIQEIEAPIIRKDNNFSIDDYRLQREFKISHTQPISLEYKELEITSSSLENSDSGIYDEVFASIQKFLYKNWQPSPLVAGNSAYVRIILSQDGTIQYCKITTAGKNPEFNLELKEYLKSLIGQKIEIDLDEAMSFEVKFRAKE